MSSSNILILGASGLTGSEVVEILSFGGIDVNVTYREEKELDHLNDKYSTSFIADYSDVDSLKSAMTGCDSLLVIQPVTPLMTKHMSNICDAIKACDVKHVTRVSNMATGPELLSVIAKMHYECDEMLKELDCTHTLIKGANYYQNMLFMALQIVRYRNFALPLGTASVAHVDSRDVALVCAHCLVDSGHENKTYTITGQESLTMHMIARKLSKIIDIEVRYISVEPIAATQVFKDQGLGDWAAESVGTMFREYASGKYNFVTDDFEKITDEWPRSIETFFTEHRTHFLREQANIR